jgi:hypothetical protein
MIGLAKMGFRVIVDRVEQCQCIVAWNEMMMKTSKQHVSTHKKCET